MKPHLFAFEKEFIDRISWLIFLRWLAVAGVFIVIIFSNLFLKIHLPVTALIMGNIFLLASNILFFLYNKRRLSKRIPHNQNSKKQLFAGLQISLDLIILAYLIHFSGGIENPFIFFFIFHMVIAGIILSNKAAYFQATLATLLILAATAGDHFGILPHHHLDGFIKDRACLQKNIKFVVGSLSSFAATLFITVYLATSIVNKLRTKEADIENANRQLKEKDRLKSQYVQTVSHDIKASLSAIQSCLQVVTKGLTGSISIKSREMVSRAEQRSESLLHFVGCLLDLSKMRAANVSRKENISLTEIIEKILDQLKPKTDEKGLIIKKINISGTRQIYANAEMIERLFINLLSNAIKYTPSGGTIKIECKQALKDEKVEYEQISISDTGIGIHQKEQWHIFEDFYRTENAQAFEKDGTGLGLAIVKHILDDHNGNIWVESQIGKGTKFGLNLSKKIQIKEIVNEE